MTDKELLLLAAKAYGGLVQAEPDGDWIHEDSDGNRGAWWNPLTDDGDAFKLAVKLGLFIDAYGTSTTVGRVIDERSLAVVTLDEKHCDDPYAATRRAIVRAAAEIGRTK